MRGRGHENVAVDERTSMRSGASLIAAWQNRLAYLLIGEICGGLGGKDSNLRPTDYESRQNRSSKPNLAC
jgi:hypothetical protein